MNLRYRVELSQAERDELKALLSGGRHAVRKVKRAQILLAADAGASDEEIATSLGVGGSTVYRTKRRFVLGNLDLALREEPRPGAGRKLSGKQEALLVATACSSPPEGRARWTRVSQQSKWEIGLGGWGGRIRTSASLALPTCSQRQQRQQTARRITCARPGGRSATEQPPSSAPRKTASSDTARRSNASVHAAQILRAFAPFP